MNFKKIVTIIVCIFFTFLVVDKLYPLDKKRLQKPLSTLIYDRNNNLMRMKLSSDDFWRISAKPKEIPALLKQSVLAFEDKYFYYHFGINPFSILRAAVQNTFGDRVIGASTISMQVARMMYGRSRTVKNKLIEMFNALQLEWCYSKEEILAFYLNLAPYGGNIEGVRTASKFYFQKSLDELSISEISILTTIPKNPNTNRPDKEKNLKDKRDKVLQLLHQNNVITKDQFNRAKKESIVSKRLHVPFYAPHFTSQNIFHTNDVISTIDLTLQNYVTALLKKQVAFLKESNVNNGAALILHNSTMEVLAYAGSQNFYDKDNGGQNDGVLMIRSPGSALKPFIYAKALDEGMITPKKRIFDIDLYLQAYIPQNFTKRFAGTISAEEALQYSLNIPAVTLNHLLQENSLYTILKQAEIFSIDKPKEYYGDAIALGGCGISLLDLASLYAALANGGVKKSVQFFKEEKQSLKKRLFSNGASYLIGEILSNAARSEFSAYWESIEDKPKVAFKTGTSASSKDLLTIAYTPEYTVAVWLGNFSGEKTDNLTGLQSASYTAFEIFNYLNKQKKLRWFAMPKSIIKKKICVDAIEIKECKQETEDFLIKGVNQKYPCEMIRPEILAYLLETKQINTLDDLQNHHCYQKWKNYKPLITSPQNYSVLIQNAELPDFLKKIKLNCFTYDSNKTIFWMIDDQPIQKGESGKPLYQYLPSGVHEIGCLDTKAGLKVHKIEVKEQ